MSQQGDQRGPRSGEQDDWWGELYAPDAPDTGRARAGDTLDDRFASVRRTVGSGTVRLPAPRGSGDAPTRENAEGGKEGAGEGDEGAAADPADAPHLAGRPQPGETEPEPEPEPEPKPEPEPQPRGEPAPAWAGASAASLVGGPAEPGALPEAEPGALGALVPDTVLDGARYGSCTLRAASVRGDTARREGDPRGDALLTARFGSGDAALLLVAVAAAGPGGATGADACGRRATRELCHAIGDAVGRSHARLAADVRAGRRDALKPGLQRLTDRCYGRLRAQAAAQGAQPDDFTADLRCLLLPVDPRCRGRVFFGVGAGGLFRLRAGVWQDVEPDVPGTGPDGPGPHGPGPHGGGPGGGRPSFRFRAEEAARGDTLLLCSRGLAEPMRRVPQFARRLARSWAYQELQDLQGLAGAAEPPGPASFLADVQAPLPGHGRDRTAVAVWES